MRFLRSSLGALNNHNDVNESDTDDLDQNRIKTIFLQKIDPSLYNITDNKLSAIDGQLQFFKQK